MEYLIPALTVFALSFVAMVSPGPDFLCVLKNSLGHGFKAGAMTAVGIGLGVYVHITYCMVGLAVIISSSILLFSFIKWLGAAYLVYLAVQAFRSKGWAGLEGKVAHGKPLSPRRALLQGFATNALNPKATLFFMALFTQVIDPHTPLGVQFLYGVMCSTMGILWFVSVAAVMTRPAIRARFAKVSVWIDRTCGAAFIALAAKLALARNPS
jgi:RhtB (resistance to homoserine/threonine) family protein